MSTNFNSLLRALVLLFLFSSGGVVAQTTFKGGQTYWVNGTGADMVLPKDTFASLMGTYVAGAPYVDATGLFSAISAQGVDPTTTGTINIILVPGYTGVEVRPIVIGDGVFGAFNYMSVNKSMVMKTAPGFNVTLTTSATIPANGSLFRFNGTSFFTIDGESTPGQRSITFQVPAAVTDATVKAIDMIAIGQNGCQLNTIKNCVIRGNSTPSAINTFAGVYIGGSSATPSNPNKKASSITIQSNEFEALRHGVYARGIGNVANAQDDGLVISNNIIGGTIAPGGALNTTYVGGVALAAGVYLAAQTNAVVSNNIIRNSLPSVGNFRGIELVALQTPALNKNIQISGNKIYNLVTTSAGSGVFGIRTAMGIHTDDLNIGIFNNTIGKLIATGGGNSVTAAAVNYPSGIALEDGLSANAGYYISNNTINLYGDTLPNGGVSSCITIAAGVNGGVYLRNNSLVNRMGRARVVAAGAQTNNYGLIINSTQIPFSANSNNNIHVTNTMGGNSFIAFTLRGNKNRISLAEWNDYSPAPNTTAYIPAFVNVDDTTMVIADGAASRLGSAGISIPGITTDINGNARPASPSVGAYQFAGNTSTASYPLAGGQTYRINGTQNPPIGSAGATGTFATIADAVTYLNANGVLNSGVVTLEVAAPYAGEDRFIPSIVNFTGAASVVLKNATGFTANVSTPAGLAYGNYYAVLRFMGARRITVDGLNLSLQNPLAASATLFTRVVALHSGDSLPLTNITIRNCVITGASDTGAVYSFAGIYHGHYAPAGAAAAANANIGSNNNVTIVNNTIQAVRNGIYVRGASAINTQNRSWSISRNIIGGTINTGMGVPTTYIGGNTSISTDQSGIFLKSVAASVIDSNIIRNTVAKLTVSQNFRGIDLETFNETVSRDSGLVVTKNFIYNLTTGGNAIYGIRLNLSGTAADSSPTASRNIIISNNSIAKIQATGNSAVANNPHGIIVDGPSAGAIPNAGLYLFHNTIQLTGNVLTQASNAPSCVYFTNAITGGVVLKNNILVNKIGRVPALTVNPGSNYAVNIASTTLPMRAPNGEINFNVYYAKGTGSANDFVAGFGGTNHLSLYNFKTATLQDASSYNYDVVFMNDTMPDVDPTTAGAIYSGALAVPSVTTDIYGRTRPAILNCIGAVEFNLIYTPLAGGGSYQINGVQNPPTPATPLSGSFATLNRAIQYINANGVDNFAPPANPITITIAPGYIGEGDTLITPLFDYPRMNSFRAITVRPSTGNNYTISPKGEANAFGNTGGSVFRFAGGSFFTIDGSGDGGVTRNLTIALPDTAKGTTLKVIDLIGTNTAVTDVTIKNCNIVGNSSTSAINAFAGIYSGGQGAAAINSAIPGNNNNTFENNFITRVKYGVYMRGASVTAGQQDMGNRVIRNTIGGTNNIGGATPTDYFGGIDNAAGIFMSSQINALIDSNVIRNNIRTNNTARGIELSNVSGALSVDSAITISRNIIQNIASTSGTTAYGIYMSLGAAENRAVKIINNMISGISAVGTANPSIIGIANPYGILVDGSGTISNIGLTINYNSINMGVSAPLVANAISADVMIGTAIKGGVIMRNNILQNRLGHAASPGRSFAVVVGASQNIFSYSENNNYYVNAALTTNAVATSNAGAAPVAYTTVADFAGYTKADTFSMSFNTPFTSDVDLFIPALTPTPVYGSAGSLVDVPRDILGNARSFVTPSIGAHEFNGIYADSLAPKAFDVTPFGSCSNGPYFITMRVAERNIVQDTLYYKVNNGSEQIAVFVSNSGINKTYVIPAQAINSSISYRYVVKDASASANAPATGYNYISTLFNAFPITYGFDLPNVQGWSVQQVSGSVKWDLDAFGSGNLPILAAKTGIKAAVFAASTPGSAGSRSRLISPCLDLSTLTQPIVRLYVSQNSDLPASRDSLVVGIGNGSGNWLPLRVIQRVNADFSFPGFKAFDICLAPYAGSVGLKVAIDAISAGGNNIVIDSMVIFDDLQNQAVLPASPAVFCAYDSISLTVTNSSPDYQYSLYNQTRGADFTSPKLGNGGNLNMKGLNFGIDTADIRIRYTNVNAGGVGSGCSSLMPNITKVIVRKFTNGPFLLPGTPFSGTYSLSNSLSTPDAAKATDTLTYAITPPSGLTNAQYGTAWTVTNLSVVSAFGTVASRAEFTAPGAGNAKYTVYPSTADQDTVFKLTATIRLLPSGCDSTYTRWIRITPAPVPNFNAVGGNEACALTPKAFVNTSSAEPSTLPLTYLWDFGDGTTATSANVSHTWATAGTFNVTLNVFNNIGLKSSKSLAITVKAAPAVSFTNPTVCSGSSTVFTNTSDAGTVTWDFLLNGTAESSTGAANPSYSFLRGDTQYVVRLTVTNALGCVNRLSVPTYVFPKPTASFTTGSHCLGSPAILNNTSTIVTTKPNSTYGSNWSFGNGQVALSNQPTYIFPNNGTFDVTLKVTTNFGCTDSTVRTINVYDRARANFTLTNACQFANVNIANTTTYTGGMDKVLYNWSFGDNNFSTAANPTQSYGVQGTYSVKLVTMDTVHFCKDSLIKVITVNSKPTAIFEGANGCVGTESAFKNGSIGGTGDTLSYAWDFKDGGTAATKNAAHTYTAAATYDVTLVVSTQKACTDTARKSIVINTLPVPAFTAAAPATPAADTAWTRNFTATPAGMTNYNWNFGDGSIVNTGTETISNIYNMKGIHNVVLTVTDANGCKGSITQDVNTTTSVGIESAEAVKYGIQVYPNPFTTSTNVSYRLTEASTVKVRVFDMLGRNVLDINEGTVHAGQHIVELNSAKFSSSAAAYLVRIEIDGEVITRQIIQAK